MIFLNNGELDQVGALSLLSYAVISVLSLSWGRQSESYVQMFTVLHVDCAFTAAVAMQPTTLLFR